MRNRVPLKRNEIEYLLWRHRLANGEVTTVYAVRYPSRSTRVRVVYFPRPEHLDVWCQRNGVEEAVVGGFFMRDPYRPLGELWIDGQPARHEPISAPHGHRRGSVVIDDGTVRLVERDAAASRPAGDLLQAGPLLVAGGVVVFNADEDHEGFSTGRGSSIRTSRRGATRVPRSGSRRSRWSRSHATGAARKSTEVCL